MNKLGMLLAVFSVICVGGCLCGQNSDHTITQVSEGVMQYKSEAHGGYSFNINASLLFDEESSYDNALMTSLAFGDNQSGEMIVIGVLPELMNQGGSWMNESCNRNNLAAQLKSQEDLNITQIKSISDVNYTNTKACIADTIAVEQGVEVPLIIAFAECKGRLPLYAVSGGSNSLADMELVLKTFDC